MAALVAGAARGDWSDCAAACRCRWSSGRKSALCGGAGLRALPHLHPDIQALDLTDSDLRSLPADAFSSNGLIHLQRLGLRRARISTFHRDAFKDLLILVELDLSENLIREIPRGALRGNDRLRLLALNENPLGELRDEQFPALPRLRNLELRGCQISKVHPRAFINLAPLESIDLRDNLLTSLGEISFDPLVSLKMLLLDGNPWMCDCHLRSFRNWYLSSRLKSEEQICREPAPLKDTSWDHLEAESFVCLPTIQTNERVMHTLFGNNATVSCFIRGDPVPAVSWLFDGLPLSTTGLDIVLEEGNGWSNLTLVNVTKASGGEYSCLAESDAGKARSSITVVLPESGDDAGIAESSEGIDKADVGRVVLGLLVGVVASLSAVVLAVIGVWRARRERIANSRSFTDQERKLLDGSLGGEGERISSERLTGVLELRDFSGKTQDVSIATMETCSPPLHISVEPVLPLYPPPPEFRALPTHGCGNIYISVQVASGRQPRVPDLLGGATLPRRSPRRLPLSIPLAPRPPLATLHAATLTATYDNMGPRRTATGSSSWSLTDIMPPPPPEYVSL